MAIAGSNEIYKKLSSQIESQFPGFIREEGPQFVTFLKAYFEYMDQNGKAINAVRSIQDYQDIDKTLDSFVEYFRREFMPNIPKSALADQRLLIKHIRDFYKSRGTPESYRFLFRALFNKEVDFYYPGDDILRLSDGRWLKESKLRVAAPKNIDPTLFGGIKVTGSISGATGLIQSVVPSLASGVKVYDMTIENVKGVFVDGEQVFDSEGNYATVSAQIGPITSFVIDSGGALHNLGDNLLIYGAGSTTPAKANVTRVTNKSAITARIVRTGSGYSKKNTKIHVTGGDGEGFEAVVSSYWPEEIPDARNIDTIGNMKNVPLNSNFFVLKGANSSPVNKKLSGIVKAKTSTNTVYGISGSKFNTELAIGDIVRIKGSSTALRVHSIGGAQTFVTTIRSAVNVRANGYSRLASANIFSTLETALTFNTSQYYKINAISIINPGKNYTVLPTITITDDETAQYDFDDGHGGFLGKNAVIVANTLNGTIAEIKLTEPGNNFNKYDIADVVNLTQGNNAFGTSGQVSAKSVTGASISAYTILKKTYSGTGYGTPIGVTNYPGKYIDTKGFLSWNNKIQDNFYYQEFSYVIRVSEMLDKYRDVVKKLIHPAGTKMFGSYEINSIVNTPLVVSVSEFRINFLSQLESIIATDSVVAKKTTSATTSESITTTDRIVVSSPIARGFSESITTTDSVSVTVKNVGAISEPAVATDSIGVLNRTYATSTDNIIYPADVYNVSGRMIAAISESVTSTDSVSGKTIFGSTAITTESITSIDTVGAGINYTLSTGTESISTTDSSMTPTVILGAQISESITTIDSVVGSNKITVGYTDPNGEITPYASVLISPYELILLNTVVDPTLNLNDTVSEPLVIAEYDGSTLAGWSIIDTAVVDTAIGNNAPSFRTTSRGFFTDLGQSFHNKTITFDFRPAAGADTGIVFANVAGGAGTYRVGLHLKQGTAISQGMAIGSNGDWLYIGARAGEETISPFPTADIWYSIKITIDANRVCRWYVNNVLQSSTATIPSGYNTSNTTDNYFGIVTNTSTAYFDNIKVSTPIF